MAAKAYSTTSPSQGAHLAGLLYLIVIVAGAFAEFYVRGKIVVRGDAGATSHNILANELLYRWGSVGYIADIALYVFVSVVLYELLKPVNRSLSLLALAFSLVGSAVGAVTVAFHLAPLALLSGDTYLNAFSADELQSLSLLSLKLHTLSYHLCLIFFAVHLAIVGQMIVASAVLPRLIGALLFVGAGCYLVNSFANLMYPHIAATLSPYILIPAVAGEILLALWLLLFGAAGRKSDSEPQPVR